MERMIVFVNKWADRVFDMMSVVLEKQKDRQDEVSLRETG